MDEGTEQSELETGPGTMPAEGPEPTGTPTATPSRRGLWIALAALVAVAVIGAGIVLTRDRNDDESASGTPRKLGLVKGSGAGEKAGLMAPTGDASVTTLYGYPYRQTQYVLDGTLPDLGTEGDVYEVTGPTLDAAGIGRIARALGLQGTPRQVVDGWQVEGSPGFLAVQTGGVSAGAYVSYGREASSGAGSSSPGAVGGSSGSASGDVATSPKEMPATTVVCVTDPCPGGGPDAPVPSPETTIPTGVPDTTYPPMTSPPAPTNLPDAAGAEKVARDLLTRMGVPDLGWQAEVTDQSWGVAVSCAVAPADATSSSDATTTTACPPAPDPVVIGRQVRLTAKVDGYPVAGLEWNVYVGDGSVVQGVNGLFVEFRKIAPYPLRPVADVFADLQAGTAWPIGGVMPMAMPAVGTAIGAEPAIGIAPDQPGGTIPPDVVTVTGAERGLALTGGVEDGRTVAYLVPTYRFLTKDRGTIEVLALDPAWFGEATPPSTGSTEPMPLPAPGPSSDPGDPGASGGGSSGGGSAGVVEPQPAPAVGAPDQPVTNGGPVTTPTVAMRQPG